MHTVNIQGNIYDQPVSELCSMPASMLEWDRYHLMSYAKVLNTTGNLQKKKQILSCLFLGIEHSLYLNLDPVYKLQLAELTDTFFKENYLNKNLIPHFVHDDVLYYGPDDAFTNFTFLEWILCDQFFTKWQKTEDPFNIDKLIATIYRKQKESLTDEKYDGDPRIRLNENHIKDNAKSFETLPRNLKTALLTIYIGNRNTVIRRFKRVFEDNEGEADKFGWTGVLVKLAGDKWGNKEETEYTNLYDMFISFDQNIEKLEEAERKNPQ